MSYAHIPSALHGGGGHGGGHHGGGHHGGHGGGGFRGRGGYFGPSSYGYPYPGYYDSGPLLLVSDEPEGASAWVQSGGRWQVVAKLSGGPNQVQTAALNLARQMKKTVGLSAPEAPGPTTFVHP